jgi:hypothetical protein
VITKGDGVAEDVAQEQIKPEERSSGNGAGANDEPSNLRRALKAGAIAAAAGSTVAAAAKVMSSKQGSESDEGAGDLSGTRSARMRGAARRSEPFVTAGWGAAKDSVLPMVESSARAAGKFVADNSPEVIRDNILPQFIAGFTQARERGTS